MEFHQRANGVVTPTALSLSGIRKRYGSVVALDGASLTVQKGSIHALLGENGAGKTTLMRIAYGLTAPDEGTIHVDGSLRRWQSPADAIHAAVGMVQQHFTLVPAMTIAENVALGVSTARQLGGETIQLARQFGLRPESTTPVRELSVSEQQRVELLKALSRGARILILDEPTAALPPPEVDQLFAWLRGFREGGGSVVLITHKLREALALADDITVLRRGATTWNGSREHATLDTLVTSMLGPEANSGEHPAETTWEVAPSAHEVIAEGASIVVHDRRGIARVKDANVRVRSGEIVGVAGVEGSGARDFLLALAGRVRISSGTLRLPDEIGFVPEDRHHDALLLEQSISDNVALKGAGDRRGWLHRSSVDAIADRLMTSGGIRAPGVRTPVSTLSGGNQQRLVLARELDGAPPLLIASNPTRGLDISATAEIHLRLRRAASGGMAVVYHSSDIDELLEISDRIIVVFDGRVSEVARDRAAVGRAMLGAA